MFCHVIFLLQMKESKSTKFLIHDFLSNTDKFWAEEYS